MTHSAFKTMPEASDVCSRWLSAAAPSGFGCKKKADCPPAGMQELLVVSSSGGLVALAHQTPATGFIASDIFSIKICRL